MKTLVALAFLTALNAFAAKAPEFPKHILVIADEAIGNKLTVQAAVQGELASIILSRFHESRPEKITGAFSVASSNLEWDFQGSPAQVRDAFRGLELTLGRSGRVSVKLGKNGNCQVASSMREFHYPRATRLSCSYFYSTGPKPGMSGSN